MNNVTKHGSKRVKQRIKTKNVDKIAQLAFQDGLRQADAKGRLKSYMDSISRKYLTEPVIYGENVFIYGRDKMLVTTFPLPYRLRSSANNQQRKNND
jgi:hypothetical protein